MRAITRITGAAAAAALALALTACSDTSNDADAPAQNATTQGSEQESPPADDEGDAGAELTAENFAEVMASSMQGNTRYRMTTTTSGSGVESSSVTEVHVKDGKASTRTVSKTMGQETTIVSVDSDFYMNLGPLTDNKFFKLDLGSEGGEMAKSLMDMAQSIGPEQAVEMMKDSIESVELVGEEDVAGIPTTHYELTLDLSSMGDALGQQLGQDSGATALPTDATSITSDYWVDEENRIVKTSTEMMGFTTESVYSDWDDESIVIEAPSADEITDKDPFAGLGM